MLCNAWSTSISVLCSVLPSWRIKIRNPVQCLFCSSGVFHALHMINTTVILSLLWFPTHIVQLFVFLAASCQVTFSILLRQDAVISFNCRSVTVTCCNSRATCATVFSLTAGIHTLLYTNLQAKFLKIWGLKSVNAATASHSVTRHQSVI